MKNGYAIGYGVAGAERRALLRAGVKPDNLHIDRPRATHAPKRELAIKDCRAGDVLYICNYDRLGARNSTFQSNVRRLYSKGVTIIIAAI